ncbi:MAG: NAD(P)H-hydrate dehydratase, partial [Tannerellaceae bacterium]|nr:NAD(P)H-hydrate dehydratase [Tannerellaceae bacterium]
GEWKILDIGIHPDALETTSTAWSMGAEEDISNVFEPRDKFANKGTYGHALLIAGSRGKMGAAVMSARACLRAGVGLLTVHIPQRGEQILQMSVPEAMVSFDNHKEYFTVIPELSHYEAIGIGPGLGQQLESAAALERLLQTAGKPMVIDADALNIIASNKDLLTKIPPRSILTPHPKEFDRIAGETATTYERIYKAQALAVKHNLCIVLKGAYTATCTPSGNIYFNSTGNPGMATAGSGDVLTGIILGLLAQGYEPETAAVSGVFLHGTAGDMAALYRSEESMLAGDIPEMLGKAFKALAGK